MAATARAHARPQRAAPAPSRRRRPAPTPARRARPASRPRLAGGVAWIVLVATLLAGIVAVNVAALRLNLEAQRLEEERQELVVDHAGAASELSALGAASRVEATGRGRLGLVDGEDTSYVRVRRPKP